MKNGWVEFLSGNNCLIIRNVLDFEYLRNWIKYMEMTFTSKTWSELTQQIKFENNDQYIIFECCGNDVVCSNVTIDVVSNIYKKKPLESNIINQYYRTVHDGLKKDKLLISYNHYSNEEFERCIEKLPDNGVLDVLYTLDDDGNEVFCQYDINEECYLAHHHHDDNRIFTFKIHAALDMAINDFNNNSFNDFYAELVNNFEGRLSETKTPFHYDEMEIEM